jgi:hypothetical protein
MVVSHGIRAMRASLEKMNAPLVFCAAVFSAAGLLLLA